MTTQSTETQVSILRKGKLKYFPNLLYQPLPPQNNNAGQNHFYCHTDSIGLILIRFEISSPNLYFRGIWSYRECRRKNTFCVKQTCFSYEVLVSLRKFYKKYFGIWSMHPPTKSYSINTTPFLQTHFFVKISTHYIFTTSWRRKKCKLSRDTL